MTKSFIPTRLSEIEQTQIEVLVSDGLMQTKKSIFSTTHSLSFKVNIPHLKTDLRRQDEDFDHLQTYLVKVYPNVIVAPSKPCKPQKQTSARYINKRAVLLSRFLKNVLRSRILRGDQFLMTFLAETDEKRFKAVMLLMQKFDKVKQVSELVTYDGKIELSQGQAQEILTVLAPKV